MREPDNFIEIFLQPGEYYFGDRETRIRTVLGSCIAITMWHPDAHIGGMCHYLLPSRSQDRPKGLDGRYGDEALLLLLNEAESLRTDPGEYQIKVFGGGNMFPGLRKAAGMNIGQRNVERAFELLESLQLKVAAKHVGGHGHRALIFDLWSGCVWVKHDPGAA